MIRLINNNTKLLFSNAIHCGLEIEFYTTKQILYYNKKNHHILYEDQEWLIKKENTINQYEIVFHHTNDINKLIRYEAIINEIILNNPHFIFKSYHKNISNSIHINLSIKSYTKEQIFSLCDNICQFFHHNSHLLLQHNNRVKFLNTFTPQYISWGPNNRFAGIRIKNNQIEIRFFSLFSPIEHIFNIILLLINANKKPKRDYQYGPQYGTDFTLNYKITALDIELT